MNETAMLKRIVIENYRSCLHTSLELHPKISVLIGPNGSGKTNILQAMMLVHKMAMEERFGRLPTDTFTASSQIGATFIEGSLNARLAASVDIRTDESNNDILRSSVQRWALKTGPSVRTSVSIPLTIAARGLSAVELYRRRLMFRRRPSRVLAEPPAAVIRFLSRIAVFCRGIKYYGASQFTNPSSCPVSFEIERDDAIGRPVRLRGHAKLLYDMYLASKREDSESYQQFIDLVGPRGLKLISALTFKEVPTSSIDHSVRVGGKIEKRRRSKLLVVPQFRIGSQRLSPNQLSEGTFKTLALLFNIVTAESTALLIEEPEVCVHHGLLASILELIKSYSGRKQMILSTHSDYVLDHVQPDNVFLVMRSQATGTIAQHMPKTMSRQEFAALREYLEKEGNLGEFWREGGLRDRS